MRSTVREVADGLLNNPLVSSAPWLAGQIYEMFFHDDDDDDHYHHQQQQHPTNSKPTSNSHPEPSRRFRAQFALRSLLPGSQLIPVKPTPSGGR